MKIKKMLPLAALLIGVGFVSQTNATATTAMTVYKNPWCGCCDSWADAMRNAGYDVTIVDMEDLEEIKRMASVTEQLAGCHTVIFGDYILEGHVPLEAIEKLMSELPDIRGIATPGMPAGSLGMGYDEDAEYAVYAFYASTSREPEIFYQAGQ